MEARVEFLEAAGLTHLSIYKYRTDMSLKTARASKTSRLHTTYRAEWFLLDRSKKYFRGADRGCSVQVTYSC
jgi:hypothetical protein